MLEWKVSSLPIPYLHAVSVMEKRVADIYLGRQPEMLWLLEHPPLYTAGTSANKNDLLNPDVFPVYQAGRGGQYTYHGPGQRVIYIMLDLKKRGNDLHKFIRDIENWLIISLERLGVSSHRRKGHPGVWVSQNGQEDAKIAAIGIRVRRWITFHGVSINISPNLAHYAGIVPCGIKNHGITSIKQLGLDGSMRDIDLELKNNFRKQFGL